MDDLTTLVHDAVSDVEPTDRLHSIRHEVQQRPRRSRWYAVGGAVLATAAVVTGIAVAARPSSGPAPGPAPSPTAIDSGTPSSHALPVYYLGTTAAGPRLFREFHRRAGTADSLDAAVQELTSDPEDPDYRTLWPAGAFGTARVTDGRIELEVLDRDLVGQTDVGALEAQLSLQQVVYTLQAAIGQALPVQFMYQGTLAPNVLGVPGSRPIPRATAFDVLAPVNISDPQEGRTVVGHFSANGVASSSEAVPWALLAPGTGDIITMGSAPSAGDDDGVHTWATGEIDVSGVKPGVYTFVAWANQAHSGSAAAGATKDTRTVIIP
jgi:hypothetical protein